MTDIIDPKSRVWKKKKKEKKNHPFVPMIPEIQQFKLFLPPHLDVFNTEENTRTRRHTLRVAGLHPECMSISEI